MSATVRIVPSGHEFVVQSDEPLLEAALRSGLALEFGCSNGSCGGCRGRVKKGEVREIRFHDYVMREAEKRAGTVLLCCCTADDDVVIEAREASGPDDIPLQNVRARLYGQEAAADDIAVVRLRIMRGKMLRFLAGQHVRLKLPGVNAADISIASCPCDGLNLEFHFDATNAGDLSARALAGFAKSDRFQIEGPRGSFTLDEASTRPRVFIAIDTAIAPVKSIIEHAINLELAQPIHLHWHMTQSRAPYLHNYFRSLTDALDDFSYAPMAGGVSAQSLDALPSARGVDVYVAGTEAFVASARKLLLARGLPEERLFVDALNLGRRSEQKAD